MTLPSHIREALSRSIHYSPVARTLFLSMTRHVVPDNAGPTEDVDTLELRHAMQVQVAGMTMGVAVAGRVRCDGRSMGAAAAKWLATVTWELCQDGANLEGELFMMLADVLMRLEVYAPEQVNEYRIPFGGIIREYASFRSVESWVPYDDLRVEEYARYSSVDDWFEAEGWPPPRKVIH